MSVVFVTSDETAEVLEPSDGALDLPASAVATELSSVLGGRLLTVLTMRAHEFDAALGQPSPERVAVGREVVEQSSRLLGRMRISSGP